MTKQDKQFLVACTLGDGCINKRFIKDKYVSYRFLMKHSEKQKDYFMWKAKKLEDILSVKSPRKIFHCIYKNSGRSKINAFQYEKASIKKLKPIYNLCYRNNKKIFSKQVLNFLTPQGLAIWYMDDGSLYNAKHIRKDGSQYYSKMRLILNTYLSYEENEIIQKYFIEKWNIKWSIHKNSTDTGKIFYRLSMGTKEGRKFIKIISPFIHKSMLYKIEEKVGQKVIK